ncbi:hypothetical protein Tco_0709735 [Tanacetum coccineum]
MVTYLKHMGKYTHNQLKTKSFEEIQRLYEREHKWIANFKPMDDSSSKPAGGSRKKTLAKKRAGENQSEKSAKRQKLEDAAEEQKSAKNEEETVDPEILSAKLVMKRFEDNTPEGYNLLLWGDLKIMFKPNAEDEVWSNQQDWTQTSWKLYENCGVHSLLLDGTLTCFNMLVEKKYPLIKEILKKMLNWKLEAEVESTMAFELLKFIKS